MEVVNPKLNIENLHRELDQIVSGYKTTYIDALVHYCDQHGLEIESVIPLVKESPKLKSRIQEDAERLNYLPKRSRLPL